jgi:hypothetical protein
MRSYKIEIEMDKWCVVPCESLIQPELWSTRKCVGSQNQPGLQQGDWIHTHSLRGVSFFLKSERKPKKLSNKKNGSFETKNMVVFGNKHGWFLVKI